MQRSLRNGFLGWGWLLPCLFPVAQVVGRSVFTVFEVIYLAWAALAMLGVRAGLERLVVAFYTALLGSFLASVLAGDDPAGGLDEWAKLLAQTSIFFWTVLALEQAADGPRRLAVGLGFGGLLLLLALYVKLAFQVWDPGFTPQLHMSEDNLAFLTPFTLFLTVNRASERIRRFAIGLLLGATIAYVGASRGRAALLGLIAGLGLYAVLVAGYRVRIAVLGMMVFLGVAITFCAPTMLHKAWKGRSWMEVLDRFTSKRSVLWRQLYAHPSEGPWLGAGMGDKDGYAAVFSVDLGEKGIITVKHLHNFLLDAWFETGAIGLTALCAWLIYVLWRGARAWRTRMAERQLSGLYLAASAAILVSAFLSFSYRSKPFAIYLFLFLAVLVYLSKPPAMQRA
ncbi:MAG: O-antigen ligase family protein [Gammaproteobacteria bacterium]